MERRLAAVLISDVVDYTKRMEEDTEGTVAAWSEARDTVLKPKVAEREGRIVKFTGDGFLAEFNTVQTALECAIDLQNNLADSTLEFRMAVNLGDIIDDGEDIHGEGINIAARLEGLAEPGGICISGDVYNQVKNRVDAEYEDIGLQEVKNVAEPVKAHMVRFKNNISNGSLNENANKSDMASIAVLPLNNMSGDTEQEYFSDGMTEDLITALSRIKFLRVIARNSTFAYKGSSPDIRSVAQQLGVRYVLEGSVRKAGDRIRINVQLLEGETGGHLWAEKYDRGLEDIFEVQDEVVNTVTKEIFPHLARAEVSRAQKLSTELLGAWESNWKAMWHFNRHQDTDFKHAVYWANKATEIDPNLAIAWSTKAVAGSTGRLFGVIKTDEDYVEMAKKGVSLDASDPLCHAFLAETYMHVGNFTAAIDEYEVALKLNPNNHVAVFGMGWARVWAGEFLEGRRILEESIKLSPMDPLNGRKNVGISISFIGEGDFRKARQSIEKALTMPVQWPAKLFEISILALDGKLEEAKKLAGIFTNQHPNITIKDYESIFPFKRKINKTIIEGMRIGGVPG
ncbi:MAG: hypothetical protein CL562_08490 [Alphaproteobacteria bacterium]|nr:hypothetical protein [Alphaproteobacteria bacterium]